MSERANHFKVGIFVIVGFALFVGALFALGFKSSFGIKDKFETYVDGGVENLSVGAVVKLRGVEIGKVSSIKFISDEHPELGQQAVAIVFKVPRDNGIIDPTGNVQQTLDKEVARGLRVRIETQGFIGPSIVSLEYVNPKYYPAVPPPWKPKYYFIPSAPSQFEHVFDALENTLTRTQDLDLASLLDRTQKLVEMANRLITNINQIDFNHLGTNANALLEGLRETNHGLQDTLKDAQDTLADARDAVNGADLPALGRKTQDLEARLSSAAMELRRTLASVDTGELNSSLANVRAATEELTLLLQKWDERSSSGVPLDLFSRPPAPASSVEEPPRK